MEKKYLVISEYQSPYPNDLIFKKDEIVIIGDRKSDDPDWENWIWCQGEENQKAWIPAQYIDSKDEGSYLNQEYNALELTLNVGEEIIGTYEVNGFTIAKKKTGEVGWAPLNHLKRT